MLDGWQRDGLVFWVNLQENHLGLKLGPYLMIANELIFETFT
jgi:hypothetical protein